jgi:hypothetical protein
MYRSLNLMTGVVSVGLAALTLASSAGAQRSAGAGPKPATTTEKPATTSASKPAGKAPVARTNKWVFGAHTVAAPGVSITGPDFDEFQISTTMGAGLGVMAGYEINRGVTAFASLDVARQSSGENWMDGSWGLVHGELGIRAKLSQSNPQMTPYALAAVGRRALGSRIYSFDDQEYYDLSFYGMMLSFGGGLEYKLSPKMTMDGGLELGIGTMNTVNDDGDIGTVHANASTSVRVRAGLVWRP